MNKPKIILAKSAGFCFGVRRAVENAEKNADCNEIINTYGELIHNPQEVERLKQKGLVPVENAKLIKSRKVVIRAHGVGKNIITDLSENGHAIIDLTCPYVKKIHTIAEKHSNAGDKVVIIGTQGHPEVTGILGWCSNGVVVSTTDEVKEKISSEDSLCVVSQTTISRRMFDEISAEILKTNPRAKIFDTICLATSERQNEAVQLAEICDLVIVIGGRHSSNTKKLYELAKTVCKNTFLIEHAGEIDPQMAKDCQSIGITAGASTPDHIIKEVFYTMENITNQDNLNFEAMLDESMKSLNTGDTVKGTVVDIRPTEVVLELNGCKYNGIVDLDNLSDDPTAKPSDIVSLGDEIEAFVIQVDDYNGQVRLSKKKLEFEKNLEKLKEAFDNGTILDGKIVEIVNNGVTAMCEGVKVFIPASHVSDVYMEDFQELKGQVLPMKIIDISTGRRRRIVASVKAVLKEENAKKREAFWADAAEGKAYDGVVKSITPFGVFVDIGGVDGLVHISELTWKRINHPKEVVSEGDALQVYIKSIDKENQKISLGCKKEEDNPWTKFMASHTIGDIVTGTVVRLVPFGAFVEIDGVDGLIHISEISWRRISHPSEVLKEGQVVEVNIKEIDEEKHKISLGYKRIEDNPWEIFKSKYNVGDVVKCKVVRIAAFGAFAEIVEGVDGLIHISQISNQHVNAVADVLSPGMEVEAEIIDIKLDEGKVSLSMKALIEEESPAEEDATVEEDIPTEYIISEEEAANVSVETTEDEAVDAAEEKTEE